MKLVIGQSTKPLARSLAGTGGEALTVTGGACPMSRLGLRSLTRGGSRPITDRAVSPLRRRMVEDMTVRGFTPKTQTDYIRVVKDFTAFLGRSPDQARAEDLRRYQLHMRLRGASAKASKASRKALKDP